MENGNKVRRLGQLLGMSALLLYGCNTTADQPQANTAPAPAVTPVVSINAVMVALVDHASHVLWDVEKKGGAPKSDSEWIEIEHHAVQLASAGTLIAAGGTGKADQGWSQSPDWKKYAQQLSEVGLAADKAAGTKNLDGLIKANGRLVETCEGCHKEFKPDLPTEGITHSH